MRFLPVVTCLVVIGHPPLAAMGVEGGKTQKTPTKPSAESRRLFAKYLEETFFDRYGLTVRTSGKGNIVLTIKWQHASKAGANELIDDGVPLMAYENGFKTLIFGDGYDVKFTWDLKEKPE